MKTTTCSILRLPRIAAIAVLGVLAFPAASEAKHKNKSKGSKDRNSPVVEVRATQARAASYDGRSRDGRSYDGRSSDGRSYDGRSYDGRSYDGRSYDGRSYDGRSYDGRSYDGRYDRGRTSYHSHPRSGFTLSFGTGYAGRGYYYGPPGAAYYYERPDVRYYRNQYDAPRSYWGRESSYGGNADAEVQRALYRLGYYRGPIDGDIGPGSRRAIARFEADRGLPVRGYVSGTLVEALGLR